LKISWTQAGALAIAASAFLLGASVAAAQEQPSSPIQVSSNSGTPLLIDGVEPDKLPTGVAAGTTVCAPGPRVYKTEGDRWIFQQWSDHTPDKCITPTRPGVYRAIYAHEVLVVLKSTAPGVARSMWAPYGEPIKFEVPAVIPSGEDTRYRFDSWSDGETQFDRTNSIAPVKPTALEVRWTREQRLQIDGPENANLQGSGWYPDGTNLVLRAPETLPGESDQARWKFSQWESTSFPPAVLQNAQSPISAVTMQMPYSIRAVYQKQYLVSATSPLGTLKRDWVNEGQDVALEAPAMTDIVADQERLVFKRWDGIDGLLSPKIVGKVDKPINVTATYERQVMLKVNAPHGAAGDGWQKVGNVVTVSVPGTFSEMFLLNSSFTNFGGYPAGQSSIQVVVSEPTTLTALYRTEPNLNVLALLLLLPLLAVLVYVAHRRGGSNWLRARIDRVRAEVRVRRKSRSRPAADSGLEFTAKIPTRNGTHLPLPIGDELH
jgi:hypothetical protein